MRAPRLVLCLICSLSAVAATLATPAHGADRLARAAAGLERSPLFVHPDLLWLLSADERADIERVLRGSSVAVRVAVLPVIHHDESYGDAERVLHGIQERLDRPGLLVVVDQRGGFELRSFRLPRDLEIPIELVDVQTPPLIRERLARLVELVEHAAPGPPNTRQPNYMPISGVDGDDDSMSIWGVLLVGAIFGLFLYGFVRFAAWFGGLVMAGFRA